MSLHPYPTPYRLATTPLASPGAPHPLSCISTVTTDMGKSKGVVSRRPGFYLGEGGGYKTQSPEEAKEHPLESQDSLSEPEGLVHKNQHKLEPNAGC